MKKLYSISIIALITFSANAQTWAPQNSQTVSKLNNINFADNNTGWFFGDSTSGPVFKRCMVKKTTNQGVTWTSQNIGSDSIQILSSHAFNTSTIVAVGKFITTGGGAIIKTTNGGITWTRDTTSAPQRLFDVNFASTNVGWIVGRNGYMAKTNNGGATWTSQNSGVGQHLYSVHFADINNGWAVGIASGSISIIHTTDGGATYTTQINPFASDLFAVYALSATKAIAVGPGGKMIMTTNSGSTWSVVTSSTTNDLLDITFTDALNGWAVGTGGTIVITTDGGITWSLQTSGTTNDIKSISMKNTGLGWLCGLNGTVRYYGASPALVNELSISHVTSKVYPNPFSDKGTVVLQGSGITQNAQLKIYDILGNLVKVISPQPDGNFIIVREKLNSGLYYYSVVVNNAAISTSKFIIEE